MNEIVENHLPKRYPRWRYDLSAFIIGFAALFLLQARIRELIAFGELNGYSQFWQRPFTLEEYKIVESFSVIVFVLSVAVWVALRRMCKWVRMILYVGWSQVFVLITYGALTGLNYADELFDTLFLSLAVLITAFNLIGLPLIYIYRKFIRKPVNPSA
ncbi:MAG: hypothetical protein DWQ07_06640 [Chloroflexi bacterium]|nr:MAG: hypothetical protein DWQ07_06640 [Chloroflexota bacterium]NOH13185.1 hypothetical protein [Chloroflexota bacterium]